jgi:4-hydroxybenzoate polyprenyltransferase
MAGGKIMKILKYFIITIRPYQWTKNLLVFAALIFAGRLTQLESVQQAFVAFILFCLVSGGVYILNDITDRQEDLLHPEKKNRPIASGKLPIPVALSGAVVMLLFSLTAAFSLNFYFGFILAGYFLMTLLYSLYLKHVVILDILLVAIGFVLRAIAGAVAIGVSSSTWLVVCTFFLALFLVIGKRRHELLLLQENASGHRQILEDYNPKILDQMIAVVTAACILAYALYTQDALTVEKFQTTNLIYSVPFVVYGIFRYFYLIYKRELGGKPEVILLKDRGIILSVLFWIITIGIIIY